MCSVPTPAMGIGMATSAISGIMSYRGQAPAAADQNELLSQRSDLQQEALGNQVEEINEMATEDALEARRNAAIERGRLRTAQAETGGGQSSGALELSGSFNEGEAISIIETNRKNALRQTDIDSRSARLQTTADRSRIRKPSALGTALQIVGSAAGSL